MGATDRRMIADLVYAFYRLGHAARELPADTRMLAALFCCNAASHPLLQQLKPGWNERAHVPLSGKLAYISNDLGIDIRDIPDGIFPWKNELSEGLDADAFTQSFLQQPDLFIRVRPGKETKVRQQLTEAAIPFTAITDNCIALPISTKAESIIAVGEDAIIQDYASQRTGTFLGLGKPGHPAPALWDCCAASGGKSIMAFDLDPRIRLTVTDKRESILQNLHQRFKTAGIQNYQAFVADLTQPMANHTKLKPDIILADLPCSGSGTWARTPEQPYFFRPVQIDQYSRLQKSILSNVVPHLSPGGRLVYITCSVFKKENEEVARFIQSQFNLRLTAMQLLTGYALKADTLFVASFDR
jgi:16S rRNA (cytosine967-C5)-methyltransferase